MKFYWQIALLAVAGVKTQRILGWYDNFIASTPIPSQVSNLSSYSTYGSQGTGMYNRMTTALPSAPILSRLYEQPLEYESTTEVQSTSGSTTDVQPTSGSTPEVPSIPTSTTQLLSPYTPRNEQNSGSPNSSILSTPASFTSNISSSLSPNSSSFTTTYSPMQPTPSSSVSFTLSITSAMPIMTSAPPISFGPLPPLSFGSLTTPPSLLSSTSPTSISSSLPTTNDSFPILFTNLSSLASPYPTYTFVPSGLNFSCKDRLDGYYADQEAECQVWHWCVPGGRHYSFVCPVQTLFNQAFRVCDWWYNVDCSIAQELYSINEDLYNISNKD